jgi:CBS domain containing-hemolysin-like protein
MPDSDGSSSGAQPGLLDRLRRLIFKSRSDTLEHAIREHNGASGGSRGQQEILLNAVQFETMVVSEVSVPRTDIDAVDVNSTLEDLVRIFAETAHSRLPVYNADLDDPVGFVHVKDVLREMEPDEHGVVHARFTDRPLNRIKRDILFVPPSMRLPALLLRMKTSRIHMALVIDEHGGTDGLVSIEDLVEQIMGDIEDEHDEEDDPVITGDVASGWEADARMWLTDAEEHVGGRLVLEEDETVKAETLAGLVVAIAGRVPVKGEILRHPTGYDFEVLDADPRRVKRLRIRRLADTQPAHAVDG